MTNYKTAVSLSESLYLCVKNTKNLIVYGLKIILKCVPFRRKLVSYLSFNEFKLTDRTFDTAIQKNYPTVVGWSAKYMTPATNSATNRPRSRAKA
jgi:hypothetical protein